MPSVRENKNIPSKKKEETLLNSEFLYEIHESNETLKYEWKIEGNNTQFRKILECKISYFCHE